VDILSHRFTPSETTIENGDFFFSIFGFGGTPEEISD
jgi:hypothetical protein